MLGWWRPEGWLVSALGVALAAEIIITLTDFVVEDRDRPAIGGIAKGVRILHTRMAIVYGAMLARLMPELADAWAEPTGLVRLDAPGWMSVSATVSASGLRDAVAVWSGPARLIRPATPTASVQVGRARSSD